MFISDEDDDCVILKRFVIRSLKQILSTSQVGESSKHTNIFVSLSVKKLIQENSDEISCILTFGVCCMLFVIKLVIRN